MRWILILGVSLILTACTDRPPPTEVATPVTGITPIVMSTNDASSQTASDADMTPTPLISPQERVNCPQAPETQLIVQERGRVTDNNDETLNLRSGPSTSFDILTRLDPLDQFIVIDGPTCADGFAWFRIRHFDRIGWIAEGDSEEYYVEPYLTG